MAHIMTADIAKILSAIGRLVSVDIGIELIVTVAFCAVLLFLCFITIVLSPLTNRQQAKLDAWRAEQYDKLCKEPGFGCTRRFGGKGRRLTAITRYSNSRSQCAGAKCRLPADYYYWRAGTDHE